MRHLGYIGYMLPAQADFPSFSEGLSLRQIGGRHNRAHPCPDFPSFSEGLSLRPANRDGDNLIKPTFPFLFGGTFIEASKSTDEGFSNSHFPSFSEGLSLRQG